MKVTLTLAVAVAAILVTGCARSSLTLDKGSRQLAPVLGSESNDLQYINHVLFAKIDFEAEKVESNKMGLVAVTSSELILAEGSPSSISEREVQWISLSDIEGVAMSGPFLQIVYQDDRYVVLPYRWYSDTVGMEQLNVLSQLLEEQSVPTVAAAEIQWVRGIIRNAEGAGVHVVGSLRGRHASDYNYNYNYDMYDTGRYYNTNEVIDSQAFTPWQEWGK